MGRHRRRDGGRPWLSERTVETHVANILLKLGLDVRDEDHRRVLAVLATSSRPPAAIAEDRTGDPRLSLAGYLPMLGFVVFRKRGTLLPLERRILEVGAKRGVKGLYGFALAQELAGVEGETSLVSHGTLYKALDRLRRDGLLDAEWEDAELAAEAGRPRRRTYCITTAGRAALKADNAQARGQTRLGPAKA